MEEFEIHAPQIFELTIDSTTKSHLSEAAKWAKFLAVVGMIFLGLMIVAGIFGSTMIFRMAGNELDGPGGNFASYGSLLMAVYVVIIAAIWFFPLLFTFRFSSQMKVALAGNDQQALNHSFQNLKRCYRFVGILTIILLAIYALVIVFALIGAAAMS